MLTFMHRLLRQIVERDTLTDESDWEALRRYDFVETKFLDVPSFMEKTEFRANAMPVTKLKIDVEREKSKRQKPSEAVARSIIGATFNPFTETGRSYIRYVSKELIKHPSSKSELVMGMAKFDHSTLFVLPQPQVIERYRVLFQSFSSSGWLAKELKNIQMDDYVEFVDDLRHVYLDYMISGPMIDVMVTFMANCPELARRYYILYNFKLCCLCLGYIFPVLPTVGLNHPMSGVERVDLSSLIEPLQSYLLCGDLAYSFVTDPESIARCVKLVDILETRPFGQIIILGIVLTSMGGLVLWRDCRRLTRLRELLVTWIPVPSLQFCRVLGKWLCNFTLQFKRPKLTLERQVVQVLLPLWWASYVHRRSVVETMNKDMRTI